MKHILSFLAFLLLFPMPIHAQVIDTLTFIDTYETGHTIMQSSNTAKLRRCSSKRRGIIVAILPNNLPAPISEGINLATNIWMKYLPNDTIKIEFQYTELQDGDIQTITNYSSHGDIYYPLSLERKLFPNLSVSNPYDAKIKINSNTNWVLGFEEDSDGKNITYAIMRAIAQTLGFGSSVRKNHRFIGFSLSTGHSIFDTLIFDANGTRLEDIPNTANNRNIALENFIQQSSGFVYALKQQNAYKLYAPPTFEDFRSLKYLLNQQSLMSEQPTSSWDMDVDDITLELLQTIGWDLETSPVEIIGDGISNTGIASAYQSHRFYVTGNGSITDHNWTFSLQKSDGTWQIINTSNTQDFNILSITNISQYMRDEEGNLQGKIIFSGKLDGDDVSAIYNLYLETKPTIVNAEVISITPNENDGYYNDVVVGIKYVGCHNLTVSVEQEYNASIDVYSISTPYYVQFRIPAILSFGDTWVTIEAENQYGVEESLLTIGHTASSKSLDYTNYIASPSYEDEYDIYTLNGTKIGNNISRKDLYINKHFGKPLIILSKKNKKIKKIYHP